YGLFFFFSSRRRHTRFSRDWSSDVCSSDLADADGAGDLDPAFGGGVTLFGSARRVSAPWPEAASPRPAHTRRPPPPCRRPGSPRSEERRVGTESRCRGPQGVSEERSGTGLA